MAETIDSRAESVPARLHTLVSLRENDGTGSGMQLNCIWNVRLTSSESDIGL